MSAECPLWRRYASAGHDGDHVGGPGRAGRARPGASRELEVAGRTADNGAGPSAAVDRGIGLDTRSLHELLGRVPPPGTPSSRTSPGGEPLEAVVISHPEIPHPDPALPVSRALAVYSSVSAGSAPHAGVCRPAEAPCCRTQLGETLVVGATVATPPGQVDDSVETRSWVAVVNCVTALAICPAACTRFGELPRLFRTLWRLLIAD